MWDDKRVHEVGASFGPPPSSQLVGALLTSRRHIDLLRVICAAC
jgi:hypothetical protein